MEKLMKNNNAEDIIFQLSELILNYINKEGLNKSKSKN